MSEAQPSAASGTSDYEAEFARIRVAVEHRLTEIAPGTGGSAARLRRSVRYSLLDGGKRLRPLAALLTAQALGGDADRALNVACAIEMVHTASLIIDDLPCMDNAQQRRGKQTNHLVHGEDIAILGAIALISEAFGAISRSPGLAPEVKAQLITGLSDAIGFEGLCAGQERDLRDISEGTDIESLEQLQQQKTGALFVLCFEAGARVAGLDDEGVKPLQAFGRHAGCAFQILDDLLDTLGNLHSTGKDHANDNGKHTYTAIMSVDEAEVRAHDELAAAIAALEPTGVDIQPFAAFLDLVLQTYHQQISGKDISHASAGNA